MDRLHIDNAIVCTQYGKDEVLAINEKRTYAKFRIGKKKKFPQLHWLNYTVVTFSPDIIARLERMDLKQGTYINICGEPDMEILELEGNKKTLHTIILHSVRDIEYASYGTKEEKEAGTPAKAEPSKPVIVLDLDDENENPFKDSSEQPTATSKPETKQQPNQTEEIKPFFH